MEHFGGMCRTDLCFCFWPSWAAPKRTEKIYTLPERSNAVPIDRVAFPQYIRISTGIGEFDRVLGGGLVKGSVVLLSGEPGIGKSSAGSGKSASL